MQLKTGKLYEAGPLEDGMSKFGKEGNGKPVEANRQTQLFYRFKGSTTGQPDKMSLLNASRYSTAACPQLSVLPIPCNVLMPGVSNGLRKLDTVMSGQRGPRHIQKLRRRRARICLLTVTRLRVIVTRDKVLSRGADRRPMNIFKRNDKEVCMYIYAFANDERE